MMKQIIDLVRLEQRVKDRAEELFINTECTETQALHAAFQLFLIRGAENEDDFED